MINVQQYLTVSEIGKRSRQEDSIFTPLSIEDNHGLFMVCDGVGGLSNGKLASETTCARIAEYAATLPGGICDEESLLRSVEYASEHLARLKKENEFKSDMATTLTLFQLIDQHGYLSHIGDSRIYHFRDGEVIFRTKDHSAVQSMVDSGYLTEAEAEKHHKKNQVSSVISSRKLPEILSIIKVEARADDIFLLCSDGVLEGLGSAGIQELAKTSDLALMEQKIRATCELEANDNYSCIILKISKI